MREEIIAAEHDISHKSAGEVLKRMRIAWYWPKMNRDIQRVVNQSGRCSNTGAIARHRRGRPRRGQPWQRIGTHVAGPLPATKRSNS